MMPYVAYAQLESLQVVRNAVATFDEKCGRMIKAHPEKLREYGAELAHEAIEKGKSVEEIVAEEKSDE
jgi:aspartate ammonia-lyase